MRSCVWIAALIPFTVIACGGSSAPSGPGPNDPGPNGATINMTANNRFAPADLTVDPGTTVRWVSATSTLHTITPNDPQQPGAWARTETASTGTVLTHTFTESGRVYTYFCEPHLAEGMTGTIRVR